MSRYLVTGASGFVGRRLCENLRALGHEVWVLLPRPEDGPWTKAATCNLGFEPVPANLFDGVDGIFHLANVTHTDLTGDKASLYWRVNVTGTEDLLEAAAESGVKGFVFFSSVKAVANPGEQCVDESWGRLPGDDYGRSKRAAEERVLAAGRKYGLHVCNLRPCPVYGSGVKGNLLRMLTAVRQKRFPPLPDFGNQRSLISLDDLITVAILAMNNPKANNQTYIVADGQDYSPRQLYESMCTAMGIPLPRWRISRGLLRLAADIGDGLEWATKRKMPFNSAALTRLSTSACYRSQSIQKDLDWRPRQTFFDVLPEMIKSIPSESRHNL